VACQWGTQQCFLFRLYTAFRQKSGCKEIIRSRAVHGLSSRNDFLVKIRSKKSVEKGENQRFSHFSQKIASHWGKNGPQSVEIDDVDTFSQKSPTAGAKTARTAWKSTMFIVHTFPKKIAPAGGKSVKSVKMLAANN
jgi:hypothetical protein